MLSPEFLAIGGGSSGYAVKNSLRFRAANSAYMSRSFGTPTSNIKWTWSGWIKRGALGTQIVFNGGDGSSNNFFSVQFTAGDLIQIAQISGGAYNLQMTTSAVFRDPSAWYHIVIVYDSANATSTDRVQIYINNSRQTVSYTTGPFGASTACQWNVNARTHYLRRLDFSAAYGDMYSAEENFIDGQALTPSSFGKVDAATGEWVPTNYSGAYGTNGFRLSFEDAASTTTISQDSSGNGNNFTSSGVSVTAGTTFDQSLDTPTLNYCVLSQINKSTSGGTVKNAGMTWNSGGGGGTYYLAQSTFVLSGKCYWECVVPTTLTYHRPGIMRADQSPPSSGASYWPGGASGPANAVGYVSNDGDVYVGGSAVAAGATPSAGDIIQFAFDAATGELWIGRNGTWLNSGDPVAATGEVTTVSLSYSWVATICDASTQDCEVNFGQRAFAYTPPTGFAALNTRNLPTPSIKRSRQYFDTRLRTGTGAAASVTDLEFAPDLVWIKSRSAATDHGLYDAVRGVQKQLESNNTNVETTETTGLTAFNSNGYTVGALAQLNTNTATYADWAWKEGVTQGFDIVTYTGDGTSGRDISHNLGAVPSLIITKARTDNTYNWHTWHVGIGPDYFVSLNATNARDNSVNIFPYAGITSSSFRTATSTIKFNNLNGVDYVAYVWAGVEGFSKFGSYTGNGSTDGPFVWCGFRPRWLLVKRLSSIGSWYLIDTARNTYNATSVSLLAENAAAESGISNPAIDIVSNGIKIRNTIADFNSSGGSFVFAAFADVPFKYARAR